ncbi:MAG: DNA metabolism protein [Firmicutes bacterium]|nr:DNA metabolism protein [Bacillota bacterium]
MNDVYIYDDNFNSLLNLINILLKNKIKPFNIKNNSYCPNLLDNIIYLKTDEKNIIEIYQKSLGEEIFKIIYYVFLSNEDEKELIIYYFLLNYIKYRNKVVYMRNLLCVSEALRISKYVSRENHRFKGFTRFKELKNKVLYAEIEPENNIIELLSFHFKNRLKNECWIIKDVKRMIISIYDKNNFYVFSEDNLKFLEIEMSNSEMDIEDLWKAFYKNIGIKERRNDKCQRNFMPKKYWKNILEVSEEYEISC